MPYPAQWNLNDVKEFASNVVLFEYDHPMITFHMRSIEVSKNNYTTLKCNGATKTPEPYYDFGTNLVRFINDIHEDYVETLAKAMDYDISSQFIRLLAELSN